MSYGIAEHRHRFSVWAAARAAQRGFTTVEKLRGALEACGLVEFLASPEANVIEKTAFDALHRSWCRKAMTWLTQASVKHVTFGRASKLIAVYIKAAVVLGPGQGNSLSRVAHPPIDRILLSNLARSPLVPPSFKEKWAGKSWTQLSEDEYYELLEQLRATLSAGEPFWFIEEHWTVTAE